MSKSNLTKVTKVDLVNEKLTFDKFAELAQNPNLSDREKIGFPDSYRADHESSILKDISKKLEFSARANCKMLDIGCGASPLTHQLIKLTSQYNIALTLNDSAAMLENIKTPIKYQVLPGRFPNVVSQKSSEQEFTYDLILSYSVFQYAYDEGTSEEFIEAICDSLNTNGIALIGDIPNESKRKRFFQSEQGIKFHKSFMNTDSPPDTNFEKLEIEGINDIVLNAVVEQARSKGCNAYIIPQDNELPMSNRRDDILIYKL